MGRGADVIAWDFTPIALVLLLAGIVGCAASLAREGRLHRDRRIERRLRAMRFRPEREGW